MKNAAMGLIGFDQKKDKGRKNSAFKLIAGARYQDPNTREKI